MPRGPEGEPQDNIKPESPADEIIGTIYSTGAIIFMRKDSSTYTKYPDGSIQEDQEVKAN